MPYIFHKSIDAGVSQNSNKRDMPMDPLNFPTKRNLLLTRDRLILARKGYDLLDKKRQVLINELRAVQEQAKLDWKRLNEALDKAYKALHIAEIEMGAKKLCWLINYSRHGDSQYISHNSEYISPILTGTEQSNNRIFFRNIMGVELPLANQEDIFHPAFYMLHNTTVSVDEAILAWKEARQFIISWAAIENTMYRLSLHIKKTQKRANALGNITIPKYEARIKYIEEQLEERGRDELARLKLVKQKINQE